VLPIVLSVWIMSYVNKFFAKYIPDSLTTIFTPFLTMLIMTPVSLCVLAPVGSVLGNYIGAALIAFGDVGGFLAVAVVAALWEFLVMTGMHIVLVVMIINTLLTTGTMTGICTSGTFATFAAYGVALGAFLRLKNKDEKSNSFGFFVSGFLGGVTEPTLYGLCIRYKRTLLTLMLGGFVGGAYAGITNVTAYMMASSSVLGVLGYVAGGTANTINGCIACALSMGVAAVTTYIFGFSKDELAA
jgi:PTS system beta-glucosides-specific IIC component